MRRLRRMALVVLTTAAALSTLALPANAAQDASLRQVTVELISVRSYDTEDIFDGDELYIGGQVNGGGNIQPVALAPIRIWGSGTVRSYRHTLFSGQVAADQPLNITLRAFDEDFAKDWNQVRGDVDTVVASAAEVIAATGHWEIALIAAAVFVTFDAIAVSDKDDRLGDIIRQVRVGDLPIGQSDYFRQVSGAPVPWWSDWRYEVRYRITTSLV